MMTLLFSQLLYWDCCVEEFDNQPNWHSWIMAIELFKTDQISDVCYAYKKCMASVFT